MYHHRIPCYGNLTPGIPEVANAAKTLAAFDDNSQRPTSHSTGRTGSRQAPSFEESALRGWELAVGNLFACLRLAAGGTQLDAVLAVARDFSPRVMAASECEVLVDIAGLGRLIGPPDEIARQLAHALFDARLSASVAIGGTQTIARVLAHGVETGHDLALQGPWLQLPVEFLRELEVLPPGLNHRDRLRPYETLARWGIETLGELAALPAADLASRLGRRGAALQQLARGLDLRPFVPDPETRRFIERLELEWPIDTLEPLSFVLARLLDPLSEALERADRGAVAIRLELRLTDRSTCTRVLPLPVPMRDARVLRTLLLLALESNPPFGGGSDGPSELMIDIVSIELDPAPARIVRFSLLDRALPSPETLATLTARLSALVGESRVGSAVLLDSHAPDAFEMARFQPDVLAHPTVGPAETFLRDGGSVLRRQRVPPAIRVALERGRPVHIASSRRGIPYGAIVDAAGPWRTSGGWWLDPVPPKPRGAAEADESGPAQSTPRSGEGGWNRNEWDVALKSGAVCRIYQDRTTERWFLEGVYD